MSELKEAPVTFAAAPDRLPLLEQVEAPGLLSVIVPVLTDAKRVVATFRRYRAALENCGYELEFVYVLDRNVHHALAGLNALKAAGAPLKLIVLSRWDGEVAAIRSGFRYAGGATFLILPAETQIDDAQLPDLLHALEDGCGMALGWRMARRWSWFDRLQNGVFHKLVRILFGRAFHDLACRVQACRREVLMEILGHSTQHQFLPLLATERGFDSPDHGRVVPATLDGRHVVALGLALQRGHNAVHFQPSRLLRQRSLAICDPVQREAPRLQILGLRQESSILRAQRRGLVLSARANFCWRGLFRHACLHVVLNLDLVW